MEEDRYDDLVLQVSSQSFVLSDNGLTLPARPTAQEVDTYAGSREYQHHDYDKGNPSTGTENCHSN